MSEIINNIKKELMILNEKFVNESIDGYNFWDEHIKYVVKEAIVLAKKYKADLEMVDMQ